VSYKDLSTTTVVMLSHRSLNPSKDSRSDGSQEQDHITANTPPQPVAHQLVEDGKDQEMEGQAEDEDGEDGEGGQDGEGDEEEEHDEVEQVVGKVMITRQVSDSIIEGVESDDTRCKDPDRE
jgi:hypothetical protein